MKLKLPNLDKQLSSIAIIYCIIGLVFAFAFAFYYRWPPYGYLSPSFFWVFISWPFQAIGFVKDLLYYGLAGKPI